MVTWELFHREEAVDCSGFTKSVYYLNGIILARDASQQCYTGEDVDITKYVNDSLYTMDALQNLKKGDLVFFGRKATAECFGAIETGI